MAEICEITRTHSNTEGKRYRAGDRLAVDKPQGGLPLITKQRFKQLTDVGLARLWDPSNPQPIPRAGYGGVAGAQQVAQKQPNESRTVRKQRQKNAGTPAEPRPLANPAAGGRAPDLKQSSLSPADQAAVNANLGLRGRRGSSRSSSTTPTSSAPGPTSSTLATPPGGVSITDARNLPE